VTPLHKQKIRKTRKSSLMTIPSAFKRKKRLTLRILRTSRETSLNWSRNEYRCSRVYPKRRKTFRKKKSS